MVAHVIVIDLLVQYVRSGNGQGFSLVLPFVHIQEGSLHSERVAHA